jgi:glutaminyl-peptide cyclotransferase
LSNGGFWFKVKVLSFKIRFCNGDSDPHLTPNTAHAQTFAAIARTDNLILDIKVLPRPSHFFLILLLSIFYCCTKSEKSNSYSTNKPIPTIDFTYIKSCPHDTTSFTEGFLIHDGELYESTGATSDLPQTKSLFGIVDLTTGKIDIKVEIDRSKYFGEGITILKGKVYQLTYKTRIGFVYDATTFKRVNEFSFLNKEGWGLTTDGTNLIMSDGTYELTYLDPTTFKPLRKITVTENGIAKGNLNELEYIRGYIFANIWTTSTIVKIDPEDGQVAGKLDLNPLHNDSKNLYPGSLEMNGIAYDSVSNRVFVTGKMWPKIYQLQIRM